MSAEKKLCEFYGAPDLSTAKFVFKHTDGSERYICPLHVDEYARINPDAIRSDINP